MKNTPTNYKDTETVKFGEHLIFDAYGCNPEKLGNMELVYKVLRDLCDMADMKRFHEPIIVKADSNEVLGGKDPGGFSGFLMVYESHISVHTFTRRGFVTIDLYSCKKFPSEGILEYLTKTFEAKDANVLKMERGLNYPKDNIY